MLSVHQTRRDFMNKRDKESRRDFGISMDLIVEILKKLPAKSLMRFRSVSKQWSMIICHRRDFIESIITRSLSQPPQKVPLLIFDHSMVKELYTVYFVIAGNTKPVELLLHGVWSYRYIRGFVCCSSRDSQLVIIFNPTTRQSFPLPEIKSSPIEPSNYYFGYDPIENQYKVLNIINVQNGKPICHVFTVERGQFWRKIQCSFDDKEKFYIKFSQVCIDGSIYFIAREDNNFGVYFLLGFNIRSEKFDYVRAPEALLKALLITSGNYENQSLINYQGKLGCICFTRYDKSIWIMDNTEKQEWSRINLWLPNTTLRFLENCVMDEFSGVTSAGEIFATPRGYISGYISDNFYVYYYNIMQNSFSRVEIKGIIRPNQRNKPIFWTRGFVIHDHVENTMWL